jgi:GNAT superfamily N-acetyltransferase
MPTLDEIAIVDNTVPELDEALTLYGSAGWASYTKNPERLHRALAGSLQVLCARHDGRLVGLARTVGDAATITYLQDVLIDPAYRRLGLGRRLVQDILAAFPEVHQQVLITDSEPEQIAFYQSLGFTELRDFPGDGLRGFARFPD